MINSSIYDEYWICVNNPTTMFEAFQNGNVAATSVDIKTKFQTIVYAVLAKISLHHKNIMARLAIYHNK